MVVPTSKTTKGFDAQHTTSKKLDGFSDATNLMKHHYNVDQE